MLQFGLRSTWRRLVAAGCSASLLNDTSRWSCITRDIVLTASVVIWMKTPHTATEMISHNLLGIKTQNPTDSTATAADMTNKIPLVRVYAVEDHVRLC